jgi:plastocyanin
VVVGGPAGLVYTPEFVMAAVGDTVIFDFLAKNHTVTQSTLDLPCLFKSDGVKSGFRPNPNNTPGLETFEVAVNSLDPMWFFCAQTGHCAQGMVFAINPKDGQMAQFKENAMGNSTATTPSGTGTPITTAQPVFTGAASGLTANMGSVLMGFAAVVALAV